MEDHTVLISTPIYYCVRNLHERNEFSEAINPPQHFNAVAALFVQNPSINLYQGSDTVDNDQTSSILGLVWPFDLNCIFPLQILELNARLLAMLARPTPTNDNAFAFLPAPMQK
jgi:hypothetical protein